VALLKASWSLVVRGRGGGPTEKGKGRIVNRQIQKPITAQQQRSGRVANDPQESLRIILKGKKTK